MHQDAYGSNNFHTNEYTQIISDVEIFVLEFAKIDRERLWSKFNSSFIVGSDPDVNIKKTSDFIRLGSYNFKRKYIVFV